ncbi:uncharacterized protein B0H18DRAFT_995694 [Fomitopsis serialis]|uniref:uncharacterized protein n=1 Tax=Fomitopsis serialis TaxID=139415 RepID=UPI002007C68A|nr:uncharacterized protein B0H18DRAFT_995694 [Neoantrodia serialis]KAH9929674.1 hypothetical protein B0H18DRAFT_995694 [Neoantrodia serialis]
MADVLTQPPVAAHVGPHIAHRARTTHHDPSSSKITASTIRSLPSRNKARLAETAHVAYVDRRRFSLDGASATFRPHHRLDGGHEDGLPDADARTSFSESRQYSRAAYKRDNQDKQLPATPEYIEPSASPSHDSDSTVRQSRYDDLADAFTRDPPRLSSTTPPPVPPKSDRGHASKTRAVSIVEPSEFSHDHTHEDSHYALDYTVSDPGHGPIPSASTSVPSSGRVPRRQTFSSRPLRHSADPHHGYPSRLSWADRASLPIYRHSSFVNGHQMVSSPTSMSVFSESLTHPSHLARRKLRKSRPVSTVSSSPRGPSTSSSSPSPSSGSSLNLFRALSHKSTFAPREPAQSSAASFPRNSINLFRRCTSDHGHDGSTTASGGGSSSAHVSRRRLCHDKSHSHSSSTSHSTAVSSSLPSDHSTPATTPEDASHAASPLLNPVTSQYGEGTSTKNVDQNVAPRLSLRTSSGGGRKLRKRRPSQSASGTTQPSSSLSSGTPDFPGLRRSSKQGGQALSSTPSTTQDVYLPPISPVSPFGLDIPKEYTSGRRPAFPPPPKRKRSTSALAQLAWTGMSSSELAALTSRLHIQRNSFEHSSQAGKGKHAQPYEETPLGTFDPYAEGLYARGGNPKLEDVSALEEEENETEDNAGGSALGHAMSSGLSTMKRMVSPPSPITSKPRANSVYVNGSGSSPLNARAPQRKSASFLESDPMAMRRWTLAIADVPDEVLVQELDNLRKGAAAKKARAKSRTPAQSESGHTAESACSTGSTEPWRPGVHFRLGGASDSEDEGDGEEEEVLLEGFENEADEEEWKAARRALLCCRELVRTERSYQTRLRELLGAQSSHPFFSLLLSYVPALLQASEAFLVRLVDDPSAWGVSAAFIGCEEELDAAFVAWCGVVGNFYIDGDEKDKRGRKRRKSGDETTAAPGHGEPWGLSARSESQSGIAAMSKPKMSENRRFSLYGSSESGMFTAALGTGLAFGLSSSSALDAKRHGSTASFGKPAGTLTRTLSTWKRKSMPSSLSNLQTSAGVPPRGEDDDYTGPRIQPTQRIMRYVCNTKVHLLAHTPVTSPSRGLVERALESAVRIAKKCDRAQGNSAFLR